MSNASAAEQARLAARARWGATVPVRAAETVIRRCAELPDAVRAAVHEATAGEDSGDE